MESNDFVIDKSVLKAYHGSGGDVYIQDGVMKIGDSAFEDCRDLRSIIFPKSLVSIGSRAFAGADKLMSVALPESLEKIGYGAFANCSSLTAVNIPKKVTRIRFDTFIGCKNLTDMTFPESICEIEENPFEGCNCIRFHAASDHPYLAVKDGALFAKPDGRLISCPHTEVQ